MNSTSHGRAWLALTTAATALLLLATRRPTNQLIGATQVASALVLVAVVLTAAYLRAKLQILETLALETSQRVVFGIAVLALLTSPTHYRQLDDLVRRFYSDARRPFRLPTVRSLPLPAQNAVVMQAHHQLRGLRNRHGLVPGGATRGAWLSIEADSAWAHLVWGRSTIQELLGVQLIYLEVDAVLPMHQPQIGNCAKFILGRRSVERVARATSCGLKGEFSNRPPGARQRPRY